MCATHSYPVVVVLVDVEVEVLDEVLVVVELVLVDVLVEVVVDVDVDEKLTPIQLLPLQKYQPHKTRLKNSSPITGLVGSVELTLTFPTIFVMCVPNLAIISFIPWYSYSKMYW